MKRIICAALALSLASPALAKPRGLPIPLPVDPLNLNGGASSSVGQLLRNGSKTLPIPLPFDPAGLNTNSNQSPDQVVAKIISWATTAGQADLTAAIAVAKASGNNVTLPCWTAIQAFVTQIQALPPTVPTTEVTGTPIVASSGAGGGTGAVTLTGTTGVGRYFTASGTMTAGVLSNVTLLTPGAYTTNPTLLTAEPVTVTGPGAGSATGVQLGLAMASVAMLPNPHIAVDMEVASELLFALQPNSSVIVGCSALANAEAMQANTLVTTIVTGAATVAKLAP